jgi:DNA-binding protein Fis
MRSQVLVVDDEVLIRQSLDLCGENRTLAAQYLDITRQTLARKLGSGDL